MMANPQWVDREMLTLEPRSVTTLRSHVEAILPVPVNTLQRLVAGDVCEHQYHPGTGTTFEDARSCDVRRSFKLNMGFSVFRRDMARPIFAAWASCIRRRLAAVDDLVEDQYCLNVALRDNRTAAV